MDNKLEEEESELKKLLILMTMFLIHLDAKNQDDLYTLRYSQSDHNCSLVKNSKMIPLVDKRFGDNVPKIGYTCVSVQKEHYNDCKILEKNGLKALIFSYGVYEYTNLVISFKVPTKYNDGYIKVKCTKTLHKLR